MFTVSLIGVDGVGKTTVAKLLERSLPLSMKYIYMGLNMSAANFSLPTTRIWHAVGRRKLSKDKSSHFLSKREAYSSQNYQYNSLLRQVITFFRKALGMTNLILEEWYRQSIAYLYDKLGYIVIFDRHFIYDFLHTEGYETKDQGSTKKKIHNLVRSKTMLKPDLVVCLDAPAEVVFQRKGEFNIEYLEMKRRQYLSLRMVVNNFVIVDANRSLDLVVKDVGDRIIQFQKSLL
jgi:thymidylate kinase